VGRCVGAGGRGEGCAVPPGFIPGVEAFVEYVECFFFF
jgi:hypothetical protein